MMGCYQLLPVLCIVILIGDRADGVGKVIFAINAGGDAHTDINGIRFQRDPLKVGIASDYGKHLLSVGRVHPSDQILYQTERYHHSTFGYDIPITEDGNYVMVLKFCEVYFNAPNMKVFDVVLNGDHTIISDLDIHDKVGHGVAYDEMVPFKVANGAKLLVYNNQESEIRGGKIRVEFIKGYRDNPKVNAILVMKGEIEDVPQLPPVPVREEEEEPVEEQEEIKNPKNRKPSGPRSPDPYEDVTLTSAIFPVFVAIGSFIPILFCLCKL
jgi:hypothetical protein